MFVHLSKRIAMPNDTPVTKCVWNAVDGYVAAGGADGLVKVLKLDLPEAGDARIRGLAGQAQLTKNQSLDGHSGSISSLAWNEQYSKLTTADSNGTIIVWIDGTSGEFIQDMLNNRNKSRVRDMKWNSNGQMICIGHEDGNIIVGSVEGTRIAGKELKNQKLTKVEWSPDSRLLLFGFANGEIHIYDSKLNYLSHLQIFCLREGTSNTTTELAGVDWYDGKNGLLSTISKCLIICYENGQMQLMSSEDDPAPIIMDIDMHVSCIKWNDDGSVFAVAGSQAAGDKTHNFVHFYNPWGEHLKTLKVAGKNISDCTWEASSLRMVIAIDSFLYFANVRYRSSSATTPQTPNDSYIISICNSIGVTIESKYVPFQPYHITMTPSYAIIAARSMFFVWGFTGLTGMNMMKKQAFEKFIHMDDPSVTKQGEELQMNMLSNLEAKLSGLVLRYSLPACNLVEKIECQFHICKIALNSLGTLMATIDTNGNCMLIDMETKEQRDDITNFKKSDVWNVVWATDLPDCFAVLEKTKLSCVRGTEAEEAVPCSGYICEYSNLQVKVVMLDEIMKMHAKGVQAPSIDYISTYDTRLLRDIKESCEKLPLDQVSSLIEKDPHPQLWRQLAEEALNHLDIKTAEHAFVKLHDYYGLQFLRRLQQFQGEQLKRAEIAAFYKRYDDVETIYHDIDRKDLAYQLRRKLGDWFRVVQILQAGGTATVGSDTMQSEAWNELGDFYFDRQQWVTASKYYEQSRNNSQVFKCYSMAEDYTSLEKLSQSLQENDALLMPIADTFASVGLCEQAVDAYKRCNRVQEALKVCISLSQWDEGIQLAKQYNLNDVKNLLTKQAKQLLDQSKPFDAIELYKKSASYLEAAKIMFEIANKHSKENRPLLLKKKLYVLCGLLIEKYHNSMKTTSRKEKRVTTSVSAAEALQGLLSEETTASGVSDTQLLDNAWRPAEAYHYYILAQRQFKANNAEGALRSALALTEYEDILPVQCIYNLIALCATACGAFSTASKAFLKLEDHPSISEDDRKEYQKLAFQIFLK
ncbi:unnamed protein product [Didymodactylos carnosus]|uniref:Anaphase-promoting complex subunit 4 WD40 domain-containing protein n=1 Tax=Didymodactylos carnosus TaxID=1234261 RepID=A0A8S2D0U2_9BILA|nr:unnamed protein product [Didymodactylos carnosus]CAF3568329.1 unnamed protein product [Didymodactylos carnosus]